MSESARTAAAAAASEGEGSLRKGCRDALQALKESRPADAIEIATGLTYMYPLSPMAFNIAGTVFEIAANRALQISSNLDAKDLSIADLECIEDLPKEMERYFRSAMEHYSVAAQLAPNCAVTAVAHGRMLARCDMIPEAFSELKRSLGLRSPTHPDETSPWVFDEILDSDIKKQCAKDAAHQEYSLFIGLTESKVYTRCCELIEMHDPSTGRAAGARKEAKSLGTRYPFSPRAQLLHPFLHRQFVQNLPLPPESNKSRLYHQIVGNVQNCADIFNASLVISLFRAEILTYIGQQNEAAAECLRGLQIQTPDDPVDQDLPPGSVAGVGRAARIATVTERILRLLEQIEDLAEKEPPFDEPVPAPKPKHKKKPKKADSRPKQQPLAPIPIKPPPPKGEMKQSLIYRFSRLAKKKLAAAPRPEQVVGNDVVPSEMVDLFAEYCRIKSTCSKYRLVCHMCVFDNENYFTCKFPLSDLIWHCNEDHQATGLQCEVGGCFVRFRTDKEAAWHHHYCHCLPKDWWTSW